MQSKHPSVLDSPFASKEGMAPFDGLVGFLAVERRKMLSGRQSFWSTYIATLPSAEDFARFHPMYAGKEVLKTVATLPNAKVILEEIASLESFWTESRELWVSLAQKCGVQEITLDDVRWAITVLKSRGFDADLEAPVLVPIADLANSESRSTAEYFGIKDMVRGSAVIDEFRVDAKQRLQRDDELLFTYLEEGASSERYFRQYGFLLAT